MLKKAAQNGQLFFVYAFVAMSVCLCYNLYMSTNGRSQKNKTLTLEPQNIPILKQRLLSLHDLQNGTPFINRTINASLQDVLPLIPNQFADLIIIDPPYNLNKDFNGSRFSAMSDKNYTDYLESWLPAVCTKLKPTGSLYLCGDWRCIPLMQQILEKHMTIINRITWQREKGRGSKNNWKNSMEDILFAVNDTKNYYFNVDAVKMKRKVLAPYKVDGTPKDWNKTDEGNYRLTYPSNFWDDISVPFWSMPENTDHPTQKPEKLYAKLILASSKENDVVFDPFLGSGTASVVAKKLGRRYCGIEQNTEYCLWAEQRLLNAEKDSQIQGYSDGVFWERNSFRQQKRTAHKN